MSDRAEPRRAPMTEQDLRAAWVVEPPRLTGKIQVADYDPEWPRLFQREAQRICEVLGQRVVRLEHIGSTSVPGLAAKPIIDILRQPARLLARLPGDRAVSRLPRPASRPPGGPGALPAGQARAGRA